MKKIVALLAHVVLLTTLVYAQPFREDIVNFKKQDSLSAPPPHPVLFVGSSSFTLWQDVQSYFPGRTILNRGFGGSSLPDLIRYEKDVIFRYQPKQIVIYCGENDIAASDTVTAKTVLKRFQQLFTDIRSTLGNVPVVFVSMKPSPSRQKFQPVVVEANKLIRQYLKKDKHASFVNVYDAMLGKDGLPMKELFREDMLHMNSKGYGIWQKILEPYLLKG
jgi:lysophospholipase L1-like esterase